MRFLGLWLAVVGCGARVDGPVASGDTGGSGSTPGDPEPENLAGITAAHDRVRALVGVGPMRWNHDLETLAGRFLLDCQFAHSSQAERTNVVGFSYVGENLFLSGFVPTGDQVVDAWNSEKPNYHYATNTCSGECGHYTQMVWADSVELGCALKECPSGYLVACEYGPGGNIVGQRPY